MITLSKKYTTLIRLDKFMLRSFYSVLLVLSMIPSMAMSETLPDNLDKSLSNLITELNEGEFSDELLLDNQSLFNVTQSYYLIYQSRIINQLEKLEATGLSAKYSRLEDYKDNFESDVGTIINALSTYYAQEGNTDEGMIGSFLSEVKQIASYYWARFNIDSYYDSLESRFVPVLHSNSFPTEIVKNYSVDLSLDPNILPYVAGQIEEDNSELHHYDINVMNKVKDLGFDPLAIYNYVNQLPSQLYWGQKKSLSATLLNGGNAVDKARLLSELFIAAGFNAHVVDGVANVSVDRLQEFLGLTNSDDIIQTLNQTGQSFTIEKLNGDLHNLKIRHAWVDAELPFKNYRGHGVENDARDWVSLDAFYTSDNYHKLSAEDVVETQTINSYYKTAIASGIVSSPVEEIFSKKIEESSDVQSKELAFLPASMPFEVEGYYNKGNLALTELQQIVNFNLVQPGFFENELFSVDIPISDLYAKSVVLTFIPATVEDQELATVFGGVDMVPAYLMNLLPVLEVDGKRYVSGQKPLSMANVLQLNIQYQKPYLKTISKDVISGGYYAIAFNDSINTYQSDESIGLGASMLNESAQLYLDNWFASEQVIEKNTGIKYHYPVPSIAIMANANRISYFEEQAVALEWKGVELDAIFHAVNISVLDQTVSHYLGQEIELKSEVVQQFKQSITASVNRLIGLDSSWYESQIISNYFDIDAISADTLVAQAIVNGSPILTESALTDSDIQAFPQYIQQQLNWAMSNNYELYITQEKQIVNDWQGYAWIITDPQTGQGGYYLSGAIAGGTSVDSSDIIWELVDPDEKAFSSGLDSFSYLEVVGISDQILTVGDVAELKLIARGIFGEPVSDVNLQLIVTLGNGKLNGKDTLSISTDSSGSAVVNVLYGPKILESFYFDEGDSYLQKYGKLQISVKVGGNLETVIEQYYKPDIATVEVEELDRNTFLLTSNDQYGNKVANVPFSVQGFTLEANGIDSFPVSLWIDDGTKSGESTNSGFINGKTKLNGTIILGRMADVCNSYVINFFSSDEKIAGFEREVLCRDPLLIYAVCHVETDRIVKFWDGSVMPDDFDISLIPKEEVEVRYGEYKIKSIATSDGADFDSVCKYSSYQPTHGIFDDQYGMFFSGDVFGSPHSLKESNVKNEFGDTILGKKYLYGSFLCDRDSPFILNAPRLNSAGKVLVPLLKNVKVIDIVNKELCNQYLWTVTGTMEEINYFKESTGFSWTLLQLKSNIEARPYIKSGKASIVDNEIYFTGDSLGLQDFTLSTYPIDELYYRGQNFNKSVYVVDGEISDIPLASGTYSGDNFLLTEPIVVEFKLLPESVEVLGQPARLTLYKDGELVDSFIASNNASQGSIEIPIGSIFKPSSKYTVQVVFNGEGDIVSSKKDLKLPLIQDFKEKIKISKFLDISNNKQCTVNNQGAISLTKNAILTVKARRMFYIDNELNISDPVSVFGPQVTLIDNIAMDAGKNIPLIFDIDSLVVGKYQLEITALNNDTNQSETVMSILDYSLEYEDTMPVSHTLYQGVDLADASLNLTREDAALPGNTSASSLEVSRNYNSKNSNQGIMGAGWSDNNLVTLYERPCGYVIANGIRFIESSGEYTPAKGYHGSLKEYGESYVLTTVGGTQYYFEKHVEGIHRVLNVKYADGYNVKYAYQNNTDEIRLSRMDDNFDRFVEYEYSTKQSSESLDFMTRVTKINVNDYRTIYYDYDDSARLKDVYLQTAGFNKQLIEHYTYSTAITVDEALHKTYKEKNEYPTIEYPSFYEDSVLGTNQQTQRLPLLLSVSDALGQETSYQYEPQKLNKLEVIDPSLVGYGYPTLVKVTNKNGDVTQFNYQFAGASDGSATIKRPIGTITYELDNYGSAKKMTDDSGAELFVFNDDHLLEKHTDKNGNTTTYEYDVHGNKISEEIGGTTTEYEYGIIQTLAGEARNALLSKVTGNTAVEYRYNGVCPEPEYQSFPQVKRSFDENCQVVIVVDGEGNTKNYSYDDESRLIKITKKGANTDRYSKTINWAKTYTKSSETDFNGHTTRYVYNHLGQLIKQTNPNGDHHILARDSLGQVTSEIDYIGRIKTYEYDAMGNQTEVNYQDNTQTFDYDRNGNRILATDWLGREVIYTYNKADQLTRESHPLGKNIDYDRDPNGNILSQSIDVNGVTQTTHREYDEQNRLIKETDAENYMQLWEYDDSNNVKTQTNKNGVVTSYQYDSHGQVIEMTTSNRTWQYAYNTVGQKITETDPIGGITNYEYDGSGNLIAQQKTGEGLWSFQFDGEGNKLLEVNPLNETTSYTYNKINGLIEKVDALGQIWAFNLDGLNRVLSEERPNGVTVTYGYDQFDRQISYTDSIGLLWQRTFDAVGNLLSEADGNGKVTYHTYNVLNQLTKTQLPNNAVYNFTYDELGQKLSETDANSHITTYTYDKVGNLEEQTNPLNYSIVTTYDGEGNALTITDGRANTTQYQYNDFNEPVKTTNALNHVITMTYDGLGRVLTEVDAKGYQTDNTYREYSAGKSVVTKRNGITLQTQKFNVGGQLIATTDAQNNTVAYNYDALGRKVAEVHPLSSVLQYEYDEVGNVSSFIDGQNRKTTYDYNARNHKTSETLDGITLSYEYDGQGNQTAMVNGNNHRWEYTYTDVNQLETITTPDNVVTEHTYDANGNRISTINGKKQVTQWEYDELNRIKSLTYPEGDEYTYIYDPAGNLKYELLPNNEQIDFEYDDINRLTQRSDSNGTIDYVYDKNGNLSRQIQANLSGEGSGTEVFTYDQFDRMTSKQDIYGNVSTYGYDKNGNQTGLGYGWANGYAVAYSYDAKNRLTGVTHGFGSTALTYYRDDRIKQKTHDNGVVTEYRYDEYGNLTTLTHEQGGTVMHKFDYQYDGNQNRTQETEFNGIDTLVTDFEYDHQDRLIQAIYAGDSESQNNGTAIYTYDDNSNRETETFTTVADILSKNITYGYDNNDQLTTIVDSVANANTVVDYDILGNLSQKALTKDSETQTTDYIYDARNQLKQVQVGGSTIGQFLYDANGLRIHKTETLTDVNSQISSTTQQRYHYQGLNVIGSFDEQNQSQYRYYHDGNQILARINESAFTDLNVENNAVQTYHQDALGSTAVISNRDGSLTARYQYDAFGNVQTETGQSETNDFTYTGHERDQATGLIYAKARYYDPQLGLFLSRDPFEGYDNKPLSLHRYLYAYQNPMKYVDPDGREAYPLFGNLYDERTSLVKPFERIDTGSVVLDYALGFPASVANVGFGVLNGVSTLGSAPAIVYGEVNDLTVEQAENELTALAASTGPLAPLLMTGQKLGSAPAKLGRFLRGNKARADSVTIVENKSDLSRPAVQVESDVPVIDVPNNPNVISSTVGKNNVQWVTDSNGLPLESSGTLSEYFKGAKRSSAEVKAQATAGQRGLTDDHGGHLAAHRFVLDQGDKNLFPQNKNFNNSAFKTLENDYARFIDQGHSVEFKHVLGDFNSVTGRPDALRVNYKVFDSNGDLVHKYFNKFNNQHGEVYKRASQ